MAEIGNVTVRVDAIITDEQYREAMSAVSAANEYIAALEAENVRLRELLARVECARRDLCDAYPDAELLNCEECPAWSACGGDLVGIMRELGIEVD